MKPKKDVAELAADYANRGNAWSKLANGDCSGVRTGSMRSGFYGTVGKVKEAKIVAGLLAKHGETQ